MGKKRKNRKNRTHSAVNPTDLGGNSRPGSNAVEASQYVRFALSQLSGRNGHHEFEQLCFQLARRRIYPNVIPATGPVSAGGDQGKDFETYTVGDVMPVGTRSSFFAQASREKVIFACSLEKNVQKKIKSDLKAAADSKEEIEKVAKYAPGSRLFVRAIVDDKGSVFMMSDRFGTPLSNVKDLLLHARELGLKLYGVSFYVGSQAADADKWGKGIDSVRPIIEELYKEGITLEVLNIGGGFPVPYHNHKHAPELPEIVANIHNSLHMLPYIPKLIMEPGRGIVATSTVLVSQIIARNDRGNRPWLCLDAGIYNALYEAMIHQGATQYTVHPLNPPTGPSKPMTCTLAGPTGDSLDIVMRDAILPDYLDVGDKLVFENVGAYSVTMASRFNGFPAPELYIG